MKFLFAVLLMFFCVSVNAATMCVPDLSTCESCTSFVVEGSKWSAVCCGVETRGYLFWGTRDMLGGGSWRLALRLPPKDNVTSDSYLLVMTYPVVAEYGVVVCAGAFSQMAPRCAFQECYGSIWCGDTDPA